MSAVPHHDDLAKSLTSLTGREDSVELFQMLEALVHSDAPTEAVRTLVDQLRDARVLNRSLASLAGSVTPEQAHRAQVTVNAWREMADEFGLLSASEVANRVGSNAKSAKSYASEARRNGRLMGVKQLNRVLYPGFQFGDDGTLPLMRELHQAADRRDVGEETALLWMTAPTTWWGDTSRPVDHLDEPDKVLRAFEGHYGAEW